MLVGPSPGKSCRLIGNWPDGEHSPCARVRFVFLDTKEGEGAFCPRHTLTHQELGGVLYEQAKSTPLQS